VSCSKTRAGEIAQHIAERRPSHRDERVERGSRAGDAVALEHSDQLFVELGKTLAQI
jgi:hypothetical protein